MVIVPTSDVLAQVGWLFYFWWWHPAIRRPRYHFVLLRMKNGYPLRGMRDAVVRLVTTCSLVLSPYDRVFSIDDRPVRRLTRLGILRKRLQYLPEPIEVGTSVGRESARKRLNLPLGRIIVACVGLLDERKGVDALLNAFCAMIDQTDALLVMAGATPSPVAQKIECASTIGALRSRIVHVNRLLTEEEFTSYLCAADLISVLYVGHLGLASTVLRAAECRRWMLGCREGWVGETIARRGLGWTCDPLQPADVVATLRGALEALRKGEEEYPSTEWLKEHSPENFGRMLCSPS